MMMAVMGGGGETECGDLWVEDWIDFWKTNLMLKMEIGLEIANVQLAKSINKRIFQRFGSIPITFCSGFFELKTTF